MKPASRLRPYTIKDVVKQSTIERPLFIHDGRVYDLTQFVEAHPGGEILLEFHGHDISDVLVDPQYHAHSNAAFGMMEDYCIGYVMQDGETPQRVPPDTSLDSLITKLGQKSMRTNDTEGSYLNAGRGSTSTNQENLTSKDAMFISTPLGGETNASDDQEGIRKALKRSDDGFLDLNKPLFPQLWNLKIDRATYLRAVHSPRFLKEPARFFVNPILEFLSRTPWFVVPMVWLPVCYWLYQTPKENYGTILALPLFILGVCIWTLVEYTLHRYLFHLDDSIPDNRFGIMLHFLFHGVHHFLPMDRLRLVFPPALASFLVAAIYGLVRLITQSTTVTDALVSGGLFGYIGYDLTHYYLHHGRPFLEHFSEMKSYQ